MVNWATSCCMFFVRIVKVKQVYVNIFTLVMFYGQFPPPSNSIGGVG